jgi:KaiC/GvpD/RAD55 family RecA-like ATPase
MATLSKDLSQSRKLSLETLKRFSVSNVEDGWQWPTIGKQGGRALRWKSYYSQREDAPAQYQEHWAKYRWKPSKPGEGFEYFSVGGLVGSIAADGGTLYLVGGEVDVMTMFETELPNSTCFFGEGNAPASLVADLQAWGVMYVFMFPDRDLAGLNSAIKVRDMLRGSDIKLVVKCLPFEYQEKHGQDVSDYWQGYEGSKASFRLCLLELPIWPLPEPQELPVQKELKAAEDSDDLPDKFKADVLAALGGKPQFNSEGWTRKNVKCPFHNDTTASASWNEAGYLYCHGPCAQTYNGKTVGERLNIRLADYYEMPAKTAKKAVNSNGAAVGENKGEAVVFVNRKDAAREYLQTIRPEYAPTTPPIQNPIKSLHHLGGMCRMLEAGKFWMIVGGSGTGKTNYVESLVVEPLLQDGHSMITAGGEWKPKEVIGRSAQRAGGITRTDYLLNQFYKHQVAKGVPAEKLITDGVITQEDMQRTENIVNSQMEWAGEQDMIPSSAMSLITMVENVRRKVLESKYAIRLLVIDYLQMYLHNAHMPFMEQLWYLKNNLEPSYDFPGLIIIGASQVTKASAKLLRTKGKDLDSADAQEIREDPANLVTTLQPEFLRVGGLKTSPIIGYKPYGWARSTKNSEGKPGNVCLGMELGQLRWIDCIVDPEAENEEEMPF